MKYAFFPGCVLKGAAKEAYMSMMKVAEKLGIELVEIPNWTCCGASHAQGVDELTMLAVNARNLALAEQMGLPVLTVCNTCTLQLRQTKAKLDSNKELKTRVNEILKKNGLEYKGNVEVTHLLWALDEHKEILKGKVVHPLKGLKIAGYYGCHLVRPPKIMNYEDGKNPQSLENLIRILGGEPVDFDYKLKCCGFHAFFTAEHDVMIATGNAVKSAYDAGAKVMVTPCPLCQMQLDMYQKEGNEAARTSIDMPIVHLQQLIGIAIGLPESEMGFNYHVSAGDKLHFSNY